MRVLNPPDTLNKRLLGASFGEPGTSSFIEDVAWREMAAKERAGATGDMAPTQAVAGPKERIECAP
jgi:hypothetical protein